jgi:predicted DNA binding protein
MWGGSGSRRRSKPLENEIQNEILLDLRTFDPTSKLSLGEILMLTEIIELTHQEEPLPDLTEEEKRIIAEAFAQAREEGG